MTSDEPGSPMRPGSPGTASDGYLVERHIPAPRRPLPQETTDPAQTGRKEEGR